VQVERANASANALNWGEEFYRPPINVTFEYGLNDAGVEQKPCNACGDCVSGCNVGAKNTTAMNYLPDAANHGAMIFTQIEVQSLQRGNANWIVRCRLIGFGRELFRGPELHVSADIVLLAAGAIGSTSILLRSKERGLPMSARVGERFTGNGDALAFAYNTDHAIFPVGFGSHPKGSVPDAGPCITGIIDHRDTAALEDGFVIEEGSLPGAAGLFLPYVLAVSDIFVGKTVRVRDRVKAFIRIARSWVEGPYKGATRNTQVYLVMSHDSEKGKITLENDRPRIYWPNAGKEPIFTRVNSTLRKATRALGGDFIENPLWSKLLGRRLVTVHPLGGCSMGESAENAVVNHLGEVFSAVAGETVHDGLHVVDGSILPMSLGVNPLLTISALAERSCALLAKDRGLTIDYSFQEQGPKLIDRVGLTFTERMVGTLAPPITTNDTGIAAVSERHETKAEITVTIAIADLKSMLSDDSHEAAMVGTLVCPALSTGPMTIVGGRFNLFIKDPNDSSVRLMVYRAILRGIDGVVFDFYGVKTVRPGSPLNAWRETTTLVTTVSKREGDVNEVVGTGALTIRPIDFIKQLMTFTILNEKSRIKRITAVVDYFVFFATVLFREYFTLYLRTMRIL
jgi:cholesterol oxidase